MGGSLKRICSMKPEDIKITDWMRILFGDTPYEFLIEVIDTPYEFLIEVIIRILFIYILLVLTMRFMGHRMEAMISRNELIAMVSMAAAVGIPLLTPDRGLLPAVVIAIVVISIQRLIAYVTTRSASKENLLLDEITLLVSDGQLLADEMLKSRITRERMLSELRSSNIKNLAQVQRAYMEANGNFSVVRVADEKKVDTMTGLCILPTFDMEYRNRFSFSDSESACSACGNVIQENPPKASCSNCGADDWTPAMLGTKYKARE
jgi:uncharacterized membrane protein YcaP (DUF421 family)